MTAPGLWAITSYFNPIGYRRRLANYRAFRARLSVPLLAVELTGPELTDADAEIILRVPHGAVVWPLCTDRGAIRLFVFLIHSW